MKMRASMVGEGTPGVVSCADFEAQLLLRNSKQPATSSDDSRPSRWNRSNTEGSNKSRRDCPGAPHQIPPEGSMRHGRGRRGKGGMDEEGHLQAERADAGSAIRGDRAGMEFLQSENSRSSAAVAAMAVGAPAPAPAEPGKKTSKSNKIRSAETAPPAETVPPAPSRQQVVQRWQ